MRIPKLKLHKGRQQYFVRYSVHGKRTERYFGKDEASAEFAYAAWKSEYVLASVSKDVDRAVATTGFHVAAGLSPDISEEMSLGELGSKYTAWAKRNHTKNEAKNKRLFVEHVLNHVGDIYWSEIGTAEYMQLQEALIAEGRTRRRINVISSGVRTWLKWCYLQDLIGRQLHHDFKYVSHVRRGQGGVNEGQKIKGIHWGKVQPVLDYMYMSPMAAADHIRQQPGRVVPERKVADIPRQDDRREIGHGFAGTLAKTGQRYTALPGRHCSTPTESSPFDRPRSP